MVGLSMTTALLDFSLTFPLDHFFFLAFPEALLGLEASALVYQKVINKGCMMCKRVYHLKRTC